MDLTKKEIQTERRERAMACWFSVLMMPGAIMLLADSAWLVLLGLVWLVGMARFAWLWQPRWAKRLAGTDWFKRFWEC